MIRVHRNKIGSTVAASMKGTKPSGFLAKCRKACLMHQIP